MSPRIVVEAWVRGYTVASTLEDRSEVVNASGLLISTDLLEKLLRDGYSFDGAILEVYDIMGLSSPRQRAGADLEAALNLFVDELTKALGIPKLLDLLVSRHRVGR